MKDYHQLPAGEARPFLFFIGMCFAAFCFSVVVCTSLYFTLNLSILQGSGSKAVKTEKVVPARQVLSYAVK